jgi:TBC1 domain family member 5
MLGTGLLKQRSYLGWSLELKQQYIDYEALKEVVNPSIADVVDDPLSSLSNGGSQSSEWDNYYKKIELSSLIRVDLDRLYMPGIDDEYFHDNTRKERLLSVLFIWSLKHARISYRQGMHELVGTISYVLETEHRYWKSSGSDHPLAQCFHDEYLESQIYWLFDRIMTDLVDLYDPMPMNNSTESVPQIVDYCTRIQEHFLRQIDPELCDRLEEAYIQGQIYGLRWARLLLGREFPLSHTHSLRIWDYMFASCMEDPLAPIAASAHIEELRSAQSSVSSASRALHARYGSYSPLMGVLGDFMLAMLLHVRELYVVLMMNLII